MKINTSSLSISAIISFIFLVFTVIYSELNESFKKILTNLTSHHWISKSILIIIVYLISYFITQFFVKNKSSSKHKLIYALIFFTILSYLVILGFFIYEFVNKT
ncbi:hypothetical protein J4455_02235 [Candidatus Woesearchaeota archaeon]|nr:hypothetical protein [Candidatus Woesearchaeota archaeon]